MKFLKTKWFKVLVVIIYLKVFVLATISTINTARILSAYSPTLIFFLNLAMHVVGLVLIFILAVQIFLGTFRNKLVNIFGKWIFRWHIWQGILSLILVLSHPLLYFSILVISSHIFDPFKIWTDFCLLCQDKQQFFYTLGRFSFWLLPLVVIAGIIRSKPWWKQNWQYFHALSYLIFVMVVVHGYKLGYGLHLPLFKPVFVVSVILVLISFIGVIPRFIAFFKSQ